MSQPTILVITSTVRQSRKSRTIADWYIALARKAQPDVNFELLDIAEYDMPLFSEPVSPRFAQGQYTPLQQKLAKIVSRADGYVIVLGEYNYSLPAAFKNLIDYLSEREWKHKAAAFVGYGTVGAIRSIQHAVQVMAYMRVMSIPDAIHINAIHDALDESGNPKPSHTHGDIAKQLHELMWWVRALKAQRLADSGQ